MDTPRNGFERTVSIPIKVGEGAEESEPSFIDINSADNAEDVIEMLRNENASVDLWHRVALVYYRAGDTKSFYQIIDEGFKAKYPLHNSDCKESSIVPILLSTAAYFYMVATVSEGDKDRAEKFTLKAINCYNKITSFGLNGFEAEYYIGRAYILLFTKDDIQAEKHFTFILSHLDSNYVPAIVGRAFIAFAKEDYKTALMFFRRALQLEPYGVINVRVGIGHCFWKLNQPEKAKIAYERAVELYPDDNNALCALATYYLRKMKPDSILIGMKMLEKAHAICKTHPATMLLLSDHWYYRKEFDKALDFALEVCKNTTMDELRKRSAFLAGRCFQAKNDIKYAMHYYYQALSELDVEFYLPYFGLAQCYLHFNDVNNSTEALRKILLHDPNNCYVKTMLGSLCCDSEDPVQRETAQYNLKAVLDQNPEDAWARLSYATSLECIDDIKARDHYITSIELLESKSTIIEPEVYNNLGCVHFRLKDYVKASEKFHIALGLVTSSLEVGSTYRPVMTTLQFNIARTKEALHEYGSAETIYKEILKQHPSYYSCFIRLAVIYRDMNNLHEADAYFKEALQCSLEHPDVWAYIGNLHLAQGETGPAEKKFLRIIKMNDVYLKRDSYSMIALGNIEMGRILDYFYESNRTFKSYRDLLKKGMRRAVEFYRQVLVREPNNIWATNGIGCVLAAKGLFTDAREIFSQVREATGDFKDVWMNIAHTYLEQGLYFNAIQMYERCSKGFSQNTDCKLLQCIAKAHFCNKSYEEAKIALLKCRRAAPYDPNILFALAKTLRKIGWMPFQIQSGIIDSKAVMQGLRTLEQAKKFFEALSTKQSNPSYLLHAAAIEYQHCDDLIKQTPHMICRIEAEFKREQCLKVKREMEVTAFKEKQLEKRALLEQRKRTDEVDAQKRREVVRKKVEKVRQSLELEANNTMKKREKKLKRDKEQEELVDTNFIDDDGDNECVSPPAAIIIPLVGKSKAKKKKDPDYMPKEQNECAVSRFTLARQPKRSKKLSSRKNKNKRFKIAENALCVEAGTEDDRQSNDSGGRTEENIMEKKLPVQLRAISPDITSFRCINSTLKPVVGKLQSNLENSSEDDDLVSGSQLTGESVPGNNLDNVPTEKDEAAEKVKDDNMLYLDIFSNQDANAQNGLKCGEEEANCSPSDIYDDLPPVLTRANEDFNKYDYDSDSSLGPPILHCFDSDNDD